MKVHWLTLAAASTLLPDALAQNVISRHRLNEPAGSLVALNSVPGGTDAAYLNGVSVGGCTSINGSAASLDGSNDRVDFASYPAISNLTDDFTVSGWIKRSNANLLNRETILSCGSWAFGVQFTPLVTPTPEIVLAINNGAGVTTLTAPCNCTLNFPQEYFVAMVVAPGGAITFYFQDSMFSGGAVPVGSAAAGSVGLLPIAGPLGQWSIGGNEVLLSASYDGCMSDIQIFDKALTASQIESLFDNPGSTFSLGTTFCPATHNSTGFRGRMDAVGSAVVSQNNLALSASNVPPGQLGYFLTSTQTTTPINPSNSSGLICLLSLIHI